MMHGWKKDTVLEEYTRDLMIYCDDLAHEDNK